MAEIISDIKNIKNDVPTDKKPKVGDAPKRGIQNMVLTVVKKEGKYKPHHQKQLLMELLDFKQGVSTVSDIVTLIEGDPAKLARLRTVQSPYNCVMYHAKDLAKCGVLKIEKDGTSVVSAQSESSEAKPIIELSNKFAKKGAKPSKQDLESVKEVTDSDFGEALQETK